MKTSIALTTLAAKFMTLLCVSGLSMMVMPEIISAAPMSPCHEMVQTSKESQEPCEMCETALTAWETNAVSTAEIELTQGTDFESAGEVMVQTFVFELKPFQGIYQAYYPPPQVLLKAVTPITKTIVLRS